MEVCREIRSKHPEIACLMLTSFADDEALFSAIMAGAAGYVLKQVRGHRPRRRRAPGRPGRVAPRPVVDHPSARAAAPPAEPDELAGLTDQERRILDLIAEGMTNRQIGEQLFLAEKTVKNYVSNLLAKLGMSRRTEAAAYAARLSERRQHHDPHACEVSKLFRNYGRPRPVTRTTLPRAVIIEREVDCGQIYEQQRRC